MKPGFSDMFRRKFLFGCALAPAGFAAAQQNVSTAPRRPKIPVDPDQGGPVYWSGDDLKKLHATLAAKGAANNQTAPSPVGMLELPVTHTHLFNFVHRYPVPNREPVVEFNDGVTDVYFMVAGSGTMRIGGELQGRRQIPNMPGEYQGSSIEGGR